FFFFSSRRRHTRWPRDWSSDVCSSDLEMRQLEGGRLSNTSLERSKQRIQRLPYVMSVEFETTLVAGSPDLVDVSYKIEEGPASQLSGGIGYSETYRFMLNGSYADADFLGT